MTANELINKLRELSEEDLNLPVKVINYSMKDDGIFDIDSIDIIDNEMIIIE